ncbi:MAG: cob(I)yrinic acid a,c-diamide adenosyltransferase [Syntrophobacteraceae bacterium]|nr:cob(I)yrinic acid a,c-diamide adenosyltransferase [Syntrophobacteraceae bacterium]
MKPEKGLLIVFTGHGKGKTTAALGMALRAAGHGMKVLVLQFIKGAWSYGELNSLKKVEEIQIKPLGTGFTWKKENLEEDRRLAEAGWQEALSQINRAGYDMIVLDELNIILSLGLLPLKTVIEGLQSRTTSHVVVTGRNAPEELVAIADLVTEMKMIKHPFPDRGLKASKGIEF